MSEEHPGLGEDAGLGESGQLGAGGEISALIAPGTDETVYDQTVYEHAAAAWADVPGCCGCVNAVDPDWGQQLYTQVSNNPDLPTVWTSSAPNQDWATFRDVVADPDTYVNYPQGADPGTVAPGPESTVTIGGPGSYPGADPGTVAPGPDLIGAPGTYVTYPQGVDPGTVGPDSQFTTVIGGPVDPNSWMGTMLSAIDIADRNGDVRAVAELTNIMDLMGNMARPWVT